MPLLVAVNDDVEAVTLERCTRAKRILVGAAAPYAFVNHRLDHTE
jgi:hypothetical protein